MSNYRAVASAGAVFCRFSGCYELAFTESRFGPVCEGHTVISACPVRSSITDQPCLLPVGHRQYRADRFHKFKPPEYTPCGPDCVLRRGHRGYHDRGEEDEAW
jgi:hypothetical protein